MGDVWVTVGSITRPKPWVLAYLRTMPSEARCRAGGNLDPAAWALIGSSNAHNEPRHLPMTQIMPVV